MEVHLIDPDLPTQFPLLEDALEAAGFVVRPMVDFEADGRGTPAVAAKNLQPQAPE